jgi:leucyl aminopeptidase
MNITVQQGEIQKQHYDALVVNLFAGASPSGATGAVNAAIDGQVGIAINLGDFRGEAGESLLLYTNGHIAAQRVLVVGLGPRETFNAEAARRAAAVAVNTLAKLGVKNAATILHGAGAGSLDPERAALALAEASLLAHYRFETYRSKPKTSTFKKLVIVEFDKGKLGAIRRGAKRGQALAAATAFARDLVNHPGNTVTPAYLAKEARRLGRERSLKVQIINEAGIKKLGMGALLAVGQGSANKPRFIIMEHGANRRGAPLVFVGKGITFDSGGLSLKSVGGIRNMKSDMSGAAAVFGAMQAAADLQIPRRIIGLVAAAENMPDGLSFRPDDVVKTLNGKTIEILSTDAEGRLVLADALAYARRFKPAAVVDLATLTGACVTALGRHAAGLFSSDDTLANRLLNAGEQTHERLWRLPLWPEYRQQIEGDIADMKNSGGPPGGASTAAALLSEFAEGYSWAHLDIAGTAFSDADRHYLRKGGVGFGVRLLTQLAHDWQ